MIGVEPIATAIDAFTVGVPLILIGIKAVLGLRPFPSAPPKPEGGLIGRVRRHGPED